MSGAFDPVGSGSGSGGISSGEVSLLIDSKIDEHEALPDPHPLYATDANARLIAASAFIPGFLSEFRITDVAYPYYSQQNADFNAVRLNATTLRLLPTGPILFTEGLFTSAAPQIVAFPQQDIPLSSITLPPGDDTYVLYVSIDRNGLLNFTGESSARDIRWVQLAVIIIKKVSDVITFQDDFTPPVLPLPNMAGISNLERTFNTFLVSVKLETNANLTLHSHGGSIRGECVNWGNAGNVHEKVQVVENPVSFYSVIPGSSTSVAPLKTYIDPTLYWNGSSLVSVGGSSNNTTVQRIFLAIDGTYLIQYGEFVYSSLQDAVNGASVAPFTQVTSPTIAQEIARLVVVRTATDLSNPSQAVLSVAGAGSAGGGATSVVDVAIYENLQIITQPMTLSAGKNGHSVGPIIMSGAGVVHVPLGARWVVQ